MPIETPTLQPDRRDALKWIAVAGGAILASLIAVPAVLFLGDPLRRRSLGPPGKQNEADARWLPVAKMDVLYDGVPTQARVVSPSARDAWQRQGENPLGVVWLVRRGSHVTAFSSICPHAACFVDYDVAHGRFICPCHESAFALGGASLGGPAPRGLDALPVRVRDGKVWVRMVRFRGGIPSQEPL